MSDASDAPRSERGDRARPEVGAALVSLHDEPEERKLRHGLRDARVLSRASAESPSQSSSRMTEASSSVFPAAFGSRSLRWPPVPRIVAASERREGLRDEARRHRHGDEADDDDRARQERAARVAAKVPRGEAHPPAHARAPASDALVRDDAAVLQPDPPFGPLDDARIVAGEQERDAARAVKLLEEVEEAASPSPSRATPWARRRGRGPARPRRRGRPRRAAAVRPTGRPAACPRAPPRPTAASAARARDAQSFLREPADPEREGDVLFRREDGHELVRLEDEAELLAPEARAPALVERRDVLPVEDGASPSPEDREGREGSGASSCRCPRGPRGPRIRPASRASDASDTPTTRSSPRR